MIHQPLAGMQGTAEEIMIHAKEFRRIKDRMNEILIRHTGHPLDKIEKDTDRDCFMTAEEAKEYHLIDQVVDADGKARFIDRQSDTCLCRHIKDRSRKNNVTTLGRSTHLAFRRISAQNVDSVQLDSLPQHESGCCRKQPICLAKGRWM